MALPPESWDHIAMALGYNNEAEMLVDLYQNQNYSYEDISSRLGYSRGSVKRRILSLGIKSRPRGGKNYKGLIKITSQIPDEDLLGDAKRCALKYGIGAGTVYKERKRRGWNSVPSPQQNTLTSSAESSAATSCSPSGIVIIENTESGTAREDLREILSSLTTARTRES